MNFLIDADVPRSLGAFLKSNGHDVVDIRDLAGAPHADDQIYRKAQAEGRILMTTHCVRGGHLVYFPSRKPDMKTRTSSIDQIRHRYTREWLLIAVDEVDQATTTPMRGRVLAHSKDREAVYDQLLRTRVARPLVMYAEDEPPKGYAVAF